jgi:membrane protein DedA with SNARE-associated domain
MDDPSHFLQHWGYPAIFLLVFLGNLGLPIPEETVLTLAGFLVWKGELQFLITTGVGIASAVAGDNFGYWVGRHLGARAALRYGRFVFITAERVAKMQGFMSRYGATGVFLARFFPGIRFLAGPLAGTSSMQFRKFFMANLCGAVIYVPLMVSLGYGVGVGLGEQLKKIGEFEYTGLLLIVATALLILAWRGIRYQRRAAQSKG